MNNEDLNRVEKIILNKIQNVNNLSDLQKIYKSFLINFDTFYKNIQEKKIIDANYKKEINYHYRKLLFVFFKKKQLLEDIELEKQSVDIDFTLPSFNLSIKGINPIYLIKEEIEDIFLGLGFTLYESNDIDSEYYNFTLMNISKDHVSRDVENTFYVDEKDMLLCTHTSHNQARAMEVAKGKPIKIISPGKCFRKDDDDLTHSHQFMQVEGLIIDENINLGNLKEILEIFIKKMFGDNRKIRFRNSYFPFTEPSIEVDIICDNCFGKGCSKCKKTGYIEILGAGLVNPKVLKDNGYDAKKYSGLAFGIGIERIAMLKYGIDSIKHFYDNDIRFLSKFKG